MENRKFQDFCVEVKKNHGEKDFKVKNSWGTYDVYKHIRKNGWYDIGRPLKEHEFYTVIRKMNKFLAKELAKGETVEFPCRMGKLELRKAERGVSIVDGKLLVTYPIDWNETLKLWFQDEECRKNKTLLRTESKEVYRIRYNKYLANYENKSFYEFTLNRFIKKALKENINKRQVNVLW